VTKAFRSGRGEHVAVRSLDLTVRAGTVHALLGPNGAGKTTTLRMLTTLLKPTAGSATVAGYDVATEPIKVRQSIGYVSQSGSTSGEARAGEEIVDHGMLYGISQAQAEARGRELFEQLDLEGMWNRKPKTMSGGQRRRLDIAMGLTHDPRLVFLDEPTTGLDPQARANLWTHISDLRTQRGSTVFLTTHYLDEADALSDRILVIDNGEIVAADTSDNLKANVAGDLVELGFKDAGSTTTAAEKFSVIPGVSEVETDGVQVRGRLRRAGTAVPGLLRDLDRSGIELVSIEVRRPTLDDVFLNLTGRSLRDT